MARIALEVGSMVSGRRVKVSESSILKCDLGIRGVPDSMQRV